jgi:hypothetical protein
MKQTKAESTQPSHREKMIPAIVDEQDGLTPFQRFENLAKSVFSVKKEPATSKPVRPRKTKRA